jgi:hypothetical protein
MTTAQLIDQAKQEAFVNKVLGDTSATMTTILASIGDRLGLFKDLATKGPGTSAEVGRRTGTNERYVHEWLGGMVAAGYVEYDPATSRFTLPAEHVAAIATEGGPFFFGGIRQMLPVLVAVVDQVTEAFHKGGGARMWVEKTRGRHLNLRSPAAAGRALGLAQLGRRRMVLTTGLECIAFESHLNGRGVC